MATFTNSISTLNQSINIFSGTGAINIGTDATDKPITIGSGTGSSGTVIKGGTGSLTLQSLGSTSSVRVTGYNNIMQSAFGVGVNTYKELKGLEKENLRDHMTDLELIITMLGEATTTQITQQRDSKGIAKLRHDAKDGGAVAGRTRKDIERQIGTKVVSKDNFLPGKKKKLIENNKK